MSLVLSINDFDAVYGQILSDFFLISFGKQHCVRWNSTLPRRKIFVAESDKQYQAFVVVHLHQTEL